MDNIQVIVKDNQEVVSLYLSTPENVKSFNGRDGIVTSQSGDYSDFDNNFTTEQTFTDMTVTGSTDFPTQIKTNDGPSVATTAFVHSLLQDVSAGLKFKGTWNADTNIPSLTSSSGEDGNFYIVDVSGDTDLNGITDWQVGDWAVFVDADGASSWKKVDNSSVLDGQGTASYIPKWNGLGTSMTLGDSIIFDDGTNIGIGTDNPSEKLEVDGNILATGTVLGSNLSGTNTGDQDLSGYLLNTTDTLTGDLTVTGNVGIGVTSPSEKLEVDGNAKADSFIKDGSTSDDLLLGDGTTTSLSGLTITESQITDLNHFSGDWDDLTNKPSGTENYVVKWGGTEGLQDSTIYDNGTNVGIGTATPSAKLDVKGDVNVDYGNISVSDGADNEVVIAGRVNSYPLPNPNSSSILTTKDGGSYPFNSYGHLVISSRQDAERDILFRTHDTDRMVIDGSGNVGIGTSSPADKLHVDGNIYLGTSSRTIYSGGSGNLSFQNNTGNIMFLRENGSSESMRIDSLGNVGIGTATPADKLHVDGNIYLGTSNRTIYNGGSGNLSFQNDTGNIMFLRNNGSSESMRIASSGNVGIGTDNPSEKLEVIGSIQISDTDVYLQFKDTNALSENAIRRIYNADQNLYFSRRNDDGSLQSNDMVIDSTGNVGIGTNAPSYKLSVIDSVNDADVGIHINNTFDDNLPTSEPNAVIFLNAASNNGYLRVHGAPANTASKHQIDLGSEAGDSFLTFSPNGSEKMRIDSTGNVGIGITNPAKKLDVDGTIKASGSVIAGSSLISNNMTSLDGASGLNFKANDGTQLVKVEEGGNVGIGTAVPNAKLEVEGGDISVKDDGAGMILSSPNGTKYKITVANDGTLTSTAI